MTGQEREHPIAQRIATGICVVAGVLSMYLRHTEGRTVAAATALFICITAGVAVFAIRDLVDDEDDDEPGEEENT